MMQRTVFGGSEQAKLIRERRNELNLTIEEAADRANVGTKTWCRYESGEPIRQDKYRGVCRALGWIRFPIDSDPRGFDLEKYRKDECWSTYLEREFGEVAALSFTVGSELLLDAINEDLNELQAMPKGTHLGQLPASFLAEDMPKQFMMEYDYDFLYQMKSELLLLRSRAHGANQLHAGSVLDELILYLIVQRADCFFEGEESLLLEKDWEDWIFDLFLDADIEMCLYSNMYITDNNIYHFSHWAEEQF